MEQNTHDDLSIRINMERVRKHGKSHIMYGHTFMVSRKRTKISRVFVNQAINKMSLACHVRAIRPGYVTIYNIEVHNC